MNLAKMNRADIHIRDKHAACVYRAARCFEVGLGAAKSGKVLEAVIGDRRELGVRGELKSDWHGADDGTDVVRASRVGAQGKSVGRGVGIAAGVVAKKVGA